MPAKRILLKGVDYFQLLIDHHSKQNGGPGHQAQLAIFLDGIADESVLRRTLSDNEHFRQLRNARLTKNFGLGFPALLFTEHPADIPIKIVHSGISEIPENCFNVSIDVFKQPPVHIQLIIFPDNKSCILFTFHHILFDFAGVQSLIYSLAGIRDAPLLPHGTHNRSLKNKMTGFFKEVFFTFKEANTKMTIPRKRLPAKKNLAVTYHELSFNQQETSKIYEACSTYKLTLNHSLYFLTAISCALHKIIFSKQSRHRFIWVPVPVNNRKKGDSPAILFNGLTFLFYKIPAAILYDKTAVIDSLRTQMTSQIRNDMPNAFTDFTEVYKYMPMPFYYPMLNLPSWGKLSSFSFSILGKTFTELETFLNLPVTNIRNFPSNSVSPGFTFLFYEYRGELKMMSSWVKDQYTPAEQKDVLNEIKNQLLNY